MLTCTSTTSGPVAVLAFAGRLDLDGVASVRTALHKALADQPAAIVVDLADVDVDNDVTLTVFSAFASFAGRWSGCPVVMSVPDQRPRAHLHRLGITRTVSVHPNLPAAIAAARAMPVPPSVRYAVVAAADAPAIARRRVVDACRAWQLPHLVDDAELIVTELVANVVRHVGGIMDLRLTLRERYLQLAIRDGSTQRPVRRLPDPDTGEGGRGLVLVEAVAASWGCAEAIDGKVVWATLRR